MTATRALELRDEPLDGPLATPLVDDLVRDLQVRYDDPCGGGMELDPAAFVPPRGAFVVALLDGRPVGCGGLRTVRPGTGEVKRMWVDPAARGRGVARAVLAALEDRARRLGLPHLLLETGTAQPEAVALYASSGWTRTAPYGEWRDSPLSICFAKDLAPGDLP